MGDTFNIFNIITLIGGLALFLFGMNVMGDGLEKGAGNKLTSILENLTSSQFKGLLLGLGVTAIIQSSSATTVMVVGFINSGIMKLSQSVGIIMGANIGTTVTSWLLSTTDIKSGGNLILDMLKPSTFAPILALIGIILHMSTKDKKKYAVGNILLGFAVLIAGMDMMSGAVKPLAEMESFTNILLLFNNPILGVLTGTLLTAIIQSSSASVGILQAMAITGAITYSNAVPIILGMNIGTCITAVLSAIGTNKNARCAAAIHLEFNVLNTVLILAIFYIVKWTIGIPFVNDAVSAFNIAVVHTLFKVVGTALLFPFGKQLEKLAYVLVPEKGADVQPQLLDDRLLATPTVAIAQTKKIANDVAELARDSIASAISLLDNYDEEVADLVKSIETRVDNYEDKLGTYLVKLSRESLTAGDSHEVSNLLHTIGDFERMTDHAVNIYEVASELKEKKLGFSEDALKEINAMTSALKEILDMTIKAFITGDIELAKYIEPLEQVIDLLKKKMKSRHVKRLQQGTCTIETGFVFSDLITNCERIADHCSNIAVCLIQVANDSFDTHEYLNHVKADGENDFVSRYETFKEKYRI